MDLLCVFVILLVVTVVFRKEVGWVTTAQLATSLQPSAFFSILFGAVHSVLTAPIFMPIPGMRPIRSINIIQKTCLNGKY